VQAVRVPVPPGVVPAPSPWIFSQGFEILVVSAEDVHLRFGMTNFSCNFAFLMRRVVDEDSGGEVCILMHSSAASIVVLHYFGLVVARLRLSASGADIFCFLRVVGVTHMRG
jgi:hypothetical protein